MSDSFSQKTRFISLVDAILPLRYQKTKSVILIDKDQKTHYLELETYEHFVRSDSESLETETFPNNSQSQKSKLTLNDVSRLGFVPKKGTAKRFIDF